MQHGTGVSWGRVLGLCQLTQRVPVSEMDKNFSLALYEGRSGLKSSGVCLGWDVRSNGSGILEPRACFKQRKLLFVCLFFVVQHVIPLFGAVVLNFVRTKAPPLCSNGL